MKKSEKVKGKEAKAARQKRMKYVAAGAFVCLIVIAAVAFYLFNPFYARSGNTVAVYYTGSLDDGTVFDSNVDGTPLVFTIGQGKVIPGFSDAVIGMAPNTTKTVKIPAANAYGAYDESLVHTVNRSTLPSDVEFIVGERYSVTRSADNAVAYVKILNITPTTLTWDENHELAGKDLTFTITLDRIVS